MNCCTRDINGLNTVFNARTVAHALKRYRKKGLEKRARLILRQLQTQGLEGRTVLEVGPGIGGLLLEALRAGAKSAVGLELSHASRAAAQDLAAEHGLAGRVEYRPEDIAAEGAAIPPADVVVLDRVVCCYPHMQPLVAQAAAHARQALALSFPRDTWLLRLLYPLARLLTALFAGDYRLYLHPGAQIAATLQGAGMHPSSQQDHGIWRILVYQRAPRQR